MLTNPKATTGPTPGMVIKRRQVASFRTMDNTLRLRQVEGLLGSVLPLVGLALAVPDHTTLAVGRETWQSPNKAHALQGRPDGPVHILVDSTGLQVYGAGQWLEEKHGARSRRGW